MSREQTRSALFQLAAHSPYVSWINLKDVVADEAVTVEDSNGRRSVLIGRVKRDQHVIPGAVSDGVCRFYFDGTWHEEWETVEILKDNFGCARKALVWAPAVKEDGGLSLPRSTEVGGTSPDGSYAIGRKKDTTEIFPISLSDQNLSNDFCRGLFLFDEHDEDAEYQVLTSEYNRYVAICPAALPFDG